MLLVNAQLRRSDKTVFRFVRAPNGFGLESVSTEQFQHNIVVDLPQYATGRVHDDSLLRNAVRNQLSTCFHVKLGCVQLEKRNALLFFGRGLIGVFALIELVDLAAVHHAGEFLIAFHIAKLLAVIRVQDKIRVRVSASV